jgi:hypothetical protein
VKGLPPFEYRIINLPIYTSMEKESTNELEFFSSFKPPKMEPSRIIRTRHGLQDRSLFLFFSFFFAPRPSLFILLFFTSGNENAGKAERSLVDGRVFRSDTIRFTDKSLVLMRRRSRPRGFVSSLFLRFLSAFV